MRGPALSTEATTCRGRTSYRPKHRQVPPRAMACARRRPPSRHSDEREPGDVYAGHRSATSACDEHGFEPQHEAEDYHRFHDERHLARLERLRLAFFVRDRGPFPDARPLAHRSQEKVKNPTDK